jgi:hypothetical protein
LEGGESVTTPEEHEEAIERVRAVVDEERRADVPYAREREIALVSMVEGPPSTIYCTPSAERITEARCALTEYEALRPSGGFPDIRAQARAQIAARAGKNLECDYIEGAIVAYERARRGGSRS